jgi:hypothetical protein
MGDERRCGGASARFCFRSSSGWRGLCWHGSLRWRATGLESVVLGPCVDVTAGSSRGGALAGDRRSVWQAFSSFWTGLAFSSCSHSLSVSTPAWTPRCTRAGRSVCVVASSRRRLVGDGGGEQSRGIPRNLGDVYRQMRRSSADKRTRGGRVSTAGGRSSGTSFHSGGSGFTVKIVLLSLVFLICVRKTIQKRLSHKRKLVSAGRGADLRSRRALYLIS